MRMIALLGLMLLTACAGTVPASYTPQSYMNIGKGTVAVGEFSYLPHQTGKLKSNQIHTTSLGTLLIATDVSKFVMRATALEMQRAGLSIRDSSQYLIEGEISKFKADDLGWSVDWEYSITYRLIDKSSGDLIIDRFYEAKPIKTGKFGNPGDYTPSLNEMVLDPIEQFMIDIKNSGVFG